MIKRINCINIFTHKMEEMKKYEIGGRYEIRNWNRNTKEFY